MDCKTNGFHDRVGIQTSMIPLTLTSNQKTTVINYTHLDFPGKWYFMFIYIYYSIYSSSTPMAQWFSHSFCTQEIPGWIPGAFYAIPKMASVILKRENKKEKVYKRLSTHSIPNMKEEKYNKWSKGNLNKNWRSMKIMWNSNRKRLKSGKEWNRMHNELGGRAERKSCLFKKGDGREILEKKGGGWKMGENIYLLERKWIETFFSKKSCISSVWR